jgi:hypothetical protein
MIKIKDNNGTVLSGVMRSSSGGIAVVNDAEYIKYKLEQTRIREFNELSRKVDDLSLMLTKILEKLNG